MLARLFAAQGDHVEVDDRSIVQGSWRMMRGLEAECVPEWLDGVRGLWEGIVAVAETGYSCRSRRAPRPRRRIQRVDPQQARGPARLLSSAECLDDRIQLIELP